MDVIVLEGVWLDSRHNECTTVAALTRKNQPIADMFTCGGTTTMADFTIFRGNDEQLDFAFTQSGVALNVSGTTIEFEVLNADDGTILFEKSVGSGISLEAQSGANIGKGNITIDSSDTSGLDNIYQRFVYNLQFKSGGGLRTTVASGLLKIKPVTSILT